MPHPDGDHSRAAGLLLLFALAVTAFNWPLLRIAARGSHAAPFLYLFLAWAGCILALFLLCRGLGKGRTRPRSPGGE